MKNLFISLLFLGLTLPVLGQKDTLLFKNGTLIIGEIKKIQLGVITFDPDDANDITVQLRKLSSISAANRAFRIETVDDLLIFGRIYKNSQAGFVTVIYEGDTVKLSLNNIDNLYPIEKSFKEKISGTAGGGYSYTRSSELGRINFDLNARYVTKTVEYSVNMTAITTIDSGFYSRDNEYAGIGCNYYFNSRWFAGGGFSYERNVELGIKTRFQELAGIGNKLFTTRYVRLLVFTSFVANQELSLEDVHSGVLTELMTGFKFNVFRFEKPELDIQTTQYGYFSLSQERIRYDGDISVSWEMVEDFMLKLTFYSNYDSKPPGALTANVDYGTVISIAFEF